MSSARKLIVAAFVLGACSGKPETRPVTEPALVPILADAGVATSPVVTFDPSAGHLDDGPNSGPGGRPPARRATRPIELVLRSTPNAARVFVDGEDRGITPVLWQGDTGEHIFTFVKKDHAMARYRFWAVTNGVVHARLDPVADEIKPGRPQPPELVSPQVSAPSMRLSPDAPVMTAPIDAAVPLAPAIDAAAPAASIDAPSGSPVGPPF
jgi:hypothetical protein